ncbi:hypothetical protein [Antrihabitans stalactiti]|uniref:DUF445 family protein n=1 Tax=Antrihabitans stalactiti TaxID=2584121 RepID=A0A848KAP3_9NOCA|nr:hypothetical protein [Antrihabitans stalactiti]NMN93762.1 hypothetical protein [Antrihabitans stalactiti]
MSTLAAGVFLDWEELTGQSKFVVDLISIPIFSAFAGLITNWTGVIMLLAPIHFTGFYLPGVKRIFPFLPRKLQILPCWAPDGIIGFQGFIPCRAEKMASIIVDKAIYRIGGISDFYKELDPDALADSIAEKARPDVRRLATDVIEKEHKALWNTLPGPVKNQVMDVVDAELPAVSRRAFKKIGENIDELLDVKLMTIQYLRSNPDILVSIIKNMAVPELRFMVRIGMLGAPFGVILALWLSFLHYSGEHAKHAHELDPSAAYIALPGFLDSALHFFPAWLWVLLGGAMIGIIVNIIAIKVVFEPGDPQPRYKYLWKQGLFARRQHEAAAETAQQLSVEVLTVSNFTNEMLNGSGADKTRAYVEAAVAEEANRILGPFMTMAKNSFGFVDVDELERGAGVAVIDFAPSVLYSDELNKEKSKAIETFATEKFRALKPDDFGEMLYSAIEQDAWLLYAHGGLLGIIVGAIHILIFGA